VRFAVDAWMHSLFGPDLPEQMDVAWVLQRTEK